MVRLLATDLKKRHGASASAVALACCSRRLADIALDSLWEELNSLSRLMQCLPPDTWKMYDDEFVSTTLSSPLALGTDQSQYFLRFPSSEEWNRFSSYARRIRTLYFKSGPEEAMGVSLETLNLLSMQTQTLGQYPLPNLRSFYSEIDSWDFAPFLRLFLNPGLVNVEIEFAGGYPHLYCPAVISLIPTGDLTHLQLKYMGSDDRSQGVLCNLLDEASKTLRSVSLGQEPSIATINKLLQLPHLRCLDVELPVARISPPGVVFPSLENLDVMYEEPGSWIHVLQNVPLRELNVIFTGSSPAYLQTLGSSLLDSNVERTLTSLRCRSWAPAPVTEAGIHPLLSFGRLTILDVTNSCAGEGRCGVQLNNSIISEIAMALPQLTSLGLGDTPCRTFTSDVTVASLVALSTNCVDLDYLRIHFDAKNITTRGTHGNSQAHKFTCKLRTLEVGSQPLPSNHNDILLITFTIIHIFPYVETISSEGGGWDQVREGVEMFREASRIAHPAAGDWPKGTMD